MIVQYANGDLPTQVHTDSPLPWGLVLAEKWAKMHSIDYTSIEDLTVKVDQSLCAGKGFGGQLAATALQWDHRDLSPWFHGWASELVNLLDGAVKEFPVPLEVVRRDGSAVLHTWRTTGSVFRIGDCRHSLPASSEVFKSTKRIQDPYDAFVEAWFAGTQVMHTLDSYWRCPSCAGSGFRGGQAEDGALRAAIESNTRVFRGKMATPESVAGVVLKLSQGYGLRPSLQVSGDRVVINSAHEVFIDDSNTLRVRFRLLSCDRCRWTDPGNFSLRVWPRFPP
jgi:hypothetical protein